MWAWHFVKIPYFWRPLPDFGYRTLETPVRREKWRWNGVDIYFLSKVMGYQYSPKVDKICFS